MKRKDFKLYSMCHYNAYYTIFSLLELTSFRFHSVRKITGIITIILPLLSWWSWLSPHPIWFFEDPTYFCTCFTPLSVYITNNISYLDPHIWNYIARLSYWLNADLLRKPWKLENPPPPNTDMAFRGWFQIASWIKQ